MRLKPLFRAFASAPISQIFALRIGMLAFAILTLFPWSMRAQTDRATLEGTITDSKGGTIAGAKVQTKELDTGLTDERETNQYSHSVLPTADTRSSSVATGSKPNKLKKSSCKSVRRVRWTLRWPSERFLRG